MSSMLARPIATIVPDDDRPACVIHRLDGIVDRKPPIHLLTKTEDHQ
jgi:hypothetical protein